MLASLRIALFFFSFYKPTTEKTRAHPHVSTWHIVTKTRAFSYNGFFASKYIFTDCCHNGFDEISGISFFFLHLAHSCAAEPSMSESPDFECINHCYPVVEQQ